MPLYAIADDPRGKLGCAVLAVKKNLHQLFEARLVVSHPPRNIDRMSLGVFAENFSFEIHEMSPLEGWIGDGKILTIMLKFEYSREVVVVYLGYPRLAID